MFRKSLFVSSVALFFMFCGDEGTPDYCGDGHPLNSTTQFCFGDETFDKCGGNTYDPTAKFCYDERLYDRCNGLTFNPVERFCFANVPYDLCDGETWTPPNNPCITNATKFMLTVNANPSIGGTVSPMTTTSLDSGSSVTVTATENAGYEFRGWSVMPPIADINENAMSITFNINSNITLIANFREETNDVGRPPERYTITSAIIPNDGGEIAISPPNQITYEEGTEITLTATPKTGYEFVNWTGNLTLSNATITFEINSNMNMTANFRRVFPVTISNAGTGATGAGNYAEGATVTISAGTAPSGQQFRTWTTTSAGVDFVSAKNATTTFTMPANAVTVTANFMRDHFNPNIDYGTFTDTRDSQTYLTVVMPDGKTWMAENLNFNATGSWCNGIDADNCSGYGRHYNWATAMNIDAVYNSSRWEGSDVNHRGVCPNGWHLPSNAEWDVLVDYIGDLSTAGTKLKSSSILAGTDDFGFSALLGGARWTDDNYFHNVGNHGYWWSATVLDATDAWYRGIGGERVFRTSFGKTTGMSVRCVRD